MSDSQTPRSRKKRNSQTTVKSPCKDVDKVANSKLTGHDDKQEKGGTNNNIENTNKRNKASKAALPKVPDNKKLKINNGDVNNSPSQINSKTEGKPIDHKEVKSLVSVKSEVPNKGKSVHSIKFKPHLSRYQYGNYNKYYGYRNQQKFSDPRMSLLEKEWFKGKLYIITH